MSPGSMGLTTASMVVALSGAIPMQHAAAAELGFYVAGHYGQTTRTIGDKPRFDDFATAVYSAYGFTPEQTDSSLGDDTDAGFGMAAGYRLLPNLAFEAGYVDLGEIVYRNDSFGTDVVTGEQGPWFQKVALKASGISLTALGVLPLSYRWELYARAGVLFATNEIDIFITNFVGSDSPGLSDSSTELLAGAGAAFSFAEVYSARLEYQRIFDAGDELGEGDLDVLSIGITVAF